MCSGASPGLKADLSREPSGKKILNRMPKQQYLAPRPGPTFRTFSQLGFESICSTRALSCFHKWLRSDPELFADVLGERCLASLGRFPIRRKDRRLSHSGSATQANATSKVDRSDSLRPLVSRKSNRLLRQSHNGQNLAKAHHGALDLRACRCPLPS